MAEPTVNIKITTTATGNGAQQTTAAIREATAATNPWVTATKSATAAQKQLNDELKGAEQQVNRSADSFDKGAKKGANFGQSMLQGSRAVQDFSAAGIPGMVNNVEGLASALGLGASAAGGFTLAFVALEVMMKSWPAIKAAFGTEEENKKLWTSLTPDEEATERMKLFTELLERQATAYKNAAEARKQNIELAKEEEARTKRMAADAEKAFPDYFKAKKEGDLPPMPGTEGPSDDMKGALSKRDAAAGDFNAAQQQLLQKDATFQAQKALVDNTLRFALLNEQNRADAAKQAELIAADSEGGSGTATAKEVAQLQQQIDARAEKMKGMRTAGSFEATGDPAKDEVALKRALDFEREKLRVLEEQRRIAAQEVVDKQRPVLAAEAGIEGLSREEQNKRQLSGELPPAPGINAGMNSASGITQSVATMNAQIERATQQLEQALQSNGGTVLQNFDLLSRGVTGTLGNLAQKLLSLAADLKAVDGTINSVTELQKNR